MPLPPPRPRRSVQRGSRRSTPRVLVVAAFVAAFVAACLVQVPAPPATAHTDLVASDPIDGAVLVDAPRSIRLTFVEEMDPALGTVVLTVADGVPRVLDVGSGSDPASLVATVPGDLLSDAGADPTGDAPVEWRIDFRVVSRDGHPVEDGVSFTAPPPQTGDETTATEPPSASSPTPTLPPSSGEPADTADTYPQGDVTAAAGEDDPGWRGAALVAGVVLALLGALVVSVIRRVRRAPEDDPA